jgi:hypothetical protein
MNSNVQVVSRSITIPPLYPNPLLLLNIQSVNNIYLIALLIDEDVSIVIAHPNPEILPLFILFENKQLYE